MTVQLSLDPVIASHIAAINSFDVDAIMETFAEGALVKVARAQHQSEAEFIEGLLLEEGIPCMLRRAPGFDVAEMFASGARDVLVPASGAQAAREALAWEGTEASTTPEQGGEAGSPS